MVILRFLITNRRCGLTFTDVSPGHAFFGGISMEFDLEMTMKLMANTSMSDGLLTIALIPHIPLDLPFL